MPSLTNSFLTCLEFQTLNIIIIAMISPKPSDPRVSTINLVFSNMPQKKGRYYQKVLKLIWLLPQSMLEIS